MVRFDIVGLNDCPWFAKAVKLADEIAGANPRVEFHHEMLDKFNWHDFCDKMKHLRGWDVRKSPVIYEVLVESNGKALLIGDCNDFCDFAAMYFDIFYDPTTTALQGMTITNKTRFGHGFGGHDRGDAAVFNISIVNPPLKLLELLIAQLISPISMIPPGVLLHIKVFQPNPDHREMEGLFMEIMDMVSPSLFKISLCSTLVLCLYHCHLLILVE
ncbi:putative malate dehydrogenase 1B [Folsomia candida]|uniref:putative malate dehydrogenase 1B n=1 Tax=Folsomia candida TaxID=158441 RepID=UPI001604FD34|nr:putative malate dehydrogenase 1B [Folsomia candida]